MSYPAALTALRHDYPTKGMPPIGSHSKHLFGQRTLVDTTRASYIPKAFGKKNERIWKIGFFRFLLRFGISALTHSIFTIHDNSHKSRSRAIGALDQSVLDQIEEVHYNVQGLSTSEHEKGVLPHHLANAAACARSLESHLTF